eukprot:11172098-Lingulodinium_polyedra.AAC.1
MIETVQRSVPVCVAKAFLFELVVMLKFAAKARGIPVGATVCFHAVRHPTYLLFFFATHAKDPVLVVFAECEFIG